MISLTIRRISTYYRLIQRYKRPTFIITFTDVVQSLIKLFFFTFSQCFLILLPLYTREKAKRWLSKKKKTEVGKSFRVNWFSITIRKTFCRCISDDKNYVFKQFISYDIDQREFVDCVIKEETYILWKCSKYFRFKSLRNFNGENEFILLLILEGKILFLIRYLLLFWSFESRVPRNY